MRRIVVLLLIVGSLAGAVRADDPLVYRGQEIGEWLQQLSHPSASARAAAAQAFVKIGKGNQRAVGPLISLLSDRDERVRFYAAHALGKIEVYPVRCIAALTKALPDPDEHVRYAAQWSLAQIANRIADSTDRNRSVDGLLSDLLAEAETELLVAGALPGYLNQIRTAIAYLEQPGTQSAARESSAIASSGDNDEIARCLEEIVSDDLRTRVNAIEALRTLGPEGVAALLDSPDAVPEFFGPAGWLTSRAIASLGQPVVPVLIEALGHPNDEISTLAANALVELGPVASVALPDLIRLLERDETSQAVQHRVIRTMIALGPRAASATSLLIRKLKDVDRDESIQQIAAEALGSIGPDAKRAVPGLIDRLASSDVSPYVREEIASALVRIAPNSEEVTRALVAAFQESGDIFNAIGFAEKLCQCGSGASVIVPQLIEAIDETSFYQRATVVKTLGELGASNGDQVIPLLFERLMDPSEEMTVRVAAAKALGKLGPTAVQTVIEELEYGDEGSQLIAARTLVEIGAAAAPAQEALHDMLTDSRADDELRSLAAVALGQLGAEASGEAPALMEVLRDTQADSYLRSMCAVALSQIDPTAALTLESTLDDPEAEVQIASAYSLCKIAPGHERGLARLVQWLASDEYRDVAMNAVIDIGEVSLPLVVEKMNDKFQSRDTRIACLEVVSAFDDRAITPLLQALNDEELAEEAGWAIRDRGNELIPTLVASVDEEANFTRGARAILESAIEDMFSGLGEGGGDPTWEGGHALVKRPELETGERMLAAGAMSEPPGERVVGELAMTPERAEDVAAIESVEPIEAEAKFAESLPIPDGYKTVDVFYGTNRLPIDQTSTSGVGRRLFWLTAIGVLLAVVAWLVTLYRRGARRQAAAGVAGTTLVVLLGLSFFAPTAARQAADKPGPSYGGGYSDRVEMGVCQVTIPDIHQEGELEAPTLLRLQVTEDVQKHIVLRNVKRMGSDAFFASLRKSLHSKGNNILVFIHGYNVSFEDAARRTAQMSSDLRFAGAPVFYSWPSQADWWKYRVDEKNVELSVDQLKTFLLAMAQDSGADTINLVAHSMGSRALTEALKEIDVAATEQEQLFNQVILAAPDIDADIFKQRIAPAIVTSAKHITLYASSKDLALVASRTFNSGDPRAGDAGENLVVVPGIETIDVSNGDSSLLGHSYYGDNVSVLRDIEYLLRDKPASARSFLEPMSHDGELTYWLFQPPRIARRTEPRRK